MEQPVQEAVPVETVPDTASIPAPSVSQSQSPPSPVRSGFNKKIILFGGITFFLAIIVTLVFVLQRPKTDNKVVTDTKPTSAPQSKEESSPFPQVHVDTWSFNTATPSAVKSARVYRFKEGLTEDDVKTLAAKVMNNIKVNSTSTSISAYPEQDGESILYVPKNSNSIIYKALNGFSVYSTNSAAISKSKSVEQFIQNFMNDNSIVVTATYEKKNVKDTVYYEAHRDWKLLGLPDVQLLGLFNVPESIPLSQLSLTTKQFDYAQDDSIVNASDDRNAQKRSNDFNTITVGVKNGNIVSITSNIRFLTNEPQKSVVLKTYDETVKLLKSGSANDVYAAPAGNGIIDSSKIFKDNVASFSNLEVKDVFIAYLEEPSTTSQTTLEPYYVVRGYGQLKTGYRAIFLASVKASQNAVLGTSTSRLLAQYNPSQQQGTLKSPTPTKVPTPTVRPTDPPPVVNSPAPPPTCSPTVSQLANVHTTSGGVVYGQWGSNFTASRGTYVPWYISYPAGTIDSVQASEFIDDVLNNLDVRKPGETGYKEVQNGTTCFIIATENPEGGVSRSCKTFAEYVNYVLTEIGAGVYNCPREVGSISPSLFIYSQDPKHVTLTVPNTTTYTDPPTIARNWVAQVENNTVSINSLSYPYLYYEYKDVRFTRPREGWNIERSTLDEFTRSLGKKLQLNTDETSRLSFELHQAADRVSAENLFIGIIPESELHDKLPLQIQPTPQSTNRVHFYIGFTKPVSVTAPEVKPVGRSAYSVVELGAYTE